ncbi:hypothetical protein, partial [Methanosarcina horonobensis]|uniref:hypothetical protein n=1 Tax=Methanosarcina horonobensis TaxID=418008 RepID=UPI0022B92AFA
ISNKKSFVKTKKFTHTYQLNIVHYISQKVPGCQVLPANGYKIFPDLPQHTCVVSGRFNLSLEIILSQILIMQDSETSIFLSRAALSI